MIVHLHRAVRTAARTAAAVAVIEGAVGGAGDGCGIGLLIIPVPELDVAGIAAVGVEHPRNIGEHVEVGDRLPEEVIVGRDPEPVHARADGVEGRPAEAGDVVLDQLQEIGDARVGRVRKAAGVVHRIVGGAHGGVGELRLARNVDGVKMLVAGRIRHVRAHLGGRRERLGRNRRFRAREHVEAAGREGTRVDGYGPVFIRSIGRLGGGGRADADAQRCRGPVVSPLVEAEDGLGFQIVVDLERAVADAGAITAITEIVGRAAGTRHTAVVRAVVVGGPELDVAGVEIAVCDAGFIGLHGQVGHELGKDRLGGAIRDADLGEEGREGVHGGPGELARRGGERTLAERQIVGHAGEGRARGRGIEEIRILDVLAEIAVNGNVQRVDHAVAGGERARVRRDLGGQRIHRDGGRGCRDTGLDVAQAGDGERECGVGRLRRGGERDGLEILAEHGVGDRHAMVERKGRGRDRIGAQRGREGHRNVRAVIPGVGGERHGRITRRGRVGALDKDLQHAGGVLAGVVGEGPVELSAA